MCRQARLANFFSNEKKMRKKTPEFLKFNNIIGPVITRMCNKNNNTIMEILYKFLTEKRAISCLFIFSQ